MELLKMRALLCILEEAGFKTMDEVEKYMNENGLVNSNGYDWDRLYAEMEALVDGII